MLDDLRSFRRFAQGLDRFLQTRLTPEDCLALVKESLGARETAFLRLVKRGIYEHPKSPYLALFKWAGVEYGDLERMVGGDGLERTLERLYEAGVYVGLEEVKGHRPLKRQGLELEVKSGDFDNPLLAREYLTATGGSTGSRRSMSADFDLLVHDTAYKFLYHSANGIDNLPYAIWKAVPPGASGLKTALAAAKWGNPLERWFSPTPLSWGPRAFKPAALATYAIWAARRAGYRIPAPEHVALEAVGHMARWLAGAVERGRQAVLALPPNAAARVCIAATQMGLELPGAVFRVGGEALTPAKSRLAAELGARVVTAYSMAEAGSMGGGCPAPQFPDEVHLFRGKLAAIQRPRVLSDGVTAVDALYLTTLLSSTAKIMLNLDSGDFGVVTRRSCGCLMERAGLDVHLHSIGSYEKLTTGGMHFMGSRFLTLVEDVLPAAHGGHPTDYQFAEEEHGAVSRVTIVISPRVGAVEEQAVMRTVLSFLGRGSRSDRSMSVHWRQGDVLRISRTEPRATVSGKIPPLWLRRTSGVP